MFFLSLGTPVKIVTVITAEIQAAMEAVTVNLEKGLNFLQHKEIVTIIQVMLRFKWAGYLYMITIQCKRDFLVTIVKLGILKIFFLSILIMILLIAVEPLSDKVSTGLN